jgi:hypothetical protein
MRAEGDGPAVELGVQPGNEPAEVCPSTTGKPQQHVLQTVSRDQRITAVAAHHRIWQNAPGLPYIPPALRQGRGDSPRPQTLLFQLPDRYASRRGNTADPANRDASSGPPTLRAQPLRTPTRHRPFGSTCRHLATVRTTPARDHYEPVPLHVLLLLTDIPALSGRVMPEPINMCSRLRPTQPTPPSQPAEPTPRPLRRTVHGARSVVPGRALSDERRQRPHGGHLRVLDDSRAETGRDQSKVRRRPHSLAQPPRQTASPA